MTTTLVASDAHAATIRSAGAGDAARWDAYLAGRPPLSALNRFAWKQVLERAHGVPTRFALAEGRLGEVVGVLPAYVARDLRGGPRLYGLRHGLVAEDAQVAEALLADAAAHCRETGATSGLVAAGTRRVPATRFPEVARQTLSLQVAPREEDAWASLGNKTRNLVRKGEREGVRIVRGAEGVGDFYRIYSRTLARKGVPIHPRRFFEEVLGAFGDDADLLLATRDGRPVAGLLLLFHGSSAVYPYHAALPEARACAASQALLWAAMKACASRGVVELDMGESTPGGDVFRFKRNFGGEPREVYYYGVHGNPPEPAGAPSAGTTSFRRLGRWVPAAALLPLRRLQKAHGRIV